MPVRSLGHGCYRWGHGKKYCGPGARQKAEKQGRAAYSHGYAKEMKMSLAADKKRWDDLHAALAKATEAKDAYDRQLHSHYGRYETNWLTKTQRAKLEALRAKEDKIGEKIFELVTRVSPRNWSYGVPSWWVRRELTWEDAIRPKNEPLSVVVPGSWGSRDGTVTEGIQMPRKATPKNAEAAGEQYAESQIESSYFQDWVRDQLAEAAQMPPSDVLPLEDKHDAKIIAKNMLQQLEWDTKKGLGDREMKDLIGADVTPSAHDAFYVGFKKACDAARDGLADELLTIKGEMGGVKEDRRRGYHGNKRDVPIRIGAAVMVINPDSMYRSEKGTVVELDARRSAKLDNFNRERVHKGAVLVERSDGSLFVVDSRDLAFYKDAPSGGVGEARTVNAKKGGFITETYRGGTWHRFFVNCVWPTRASAEKYAKANFSVNTQWRVTSSSLPVSLPDYVARASGLDPASVPDLEPADGGPEARTVNARSASYSLRQSPDNALMYNAFFGSLEIGHVAGPYRQGKSDFYEWRLKGDVPSFEHQFGRSPVSGRARTQTAAFNALVSADKTRRGTARPKAQGSQRRA